MTGAEGASALAPETATASALASADRGQASLVSLAVALVLLTGVTALGLAVAEGALTGADGRPLERRAATVAADRIVESGATAHRPNVLDEESVRVLTPGDVDELAPAVSGRSLRVRLGNETVVARGDPDPGTTVRRAVLVANRTEVRRTVRAPRNDTLTVPRGPAEVRVWVDAENDTAVTAVRAGDRVVLYDPAGLDGSATVRIDAATNTTLSFAATGPDATITARYDEANATPTTLEVTAGAR